MAVCYNLYTTSAAVCKPSNSDVFSVFRNKIPRTSEIQPINSRNCYKSINRRARFYPVHCWMNSRARMRLNCNSKNNYYRESKKYKEIFHSFAKQRLILHIPSVCK